MSRLMLILLGEGASGMPEDDFLDESSVQAPAVTNTANCLLVDAHQEGDGLNLLIKTSRPAAGTAVLTAGGIDVSPSIITMLDAVQHASPSKTEVIALVRSGFIAFADPGPDE